MRVPWAWICAEGGVGRKVWWRGTAPSDMRPMSVRAPRCRLASGLASQCACVMLVSVRVRIYVCACVVVHMLGDSVTVGMQ